MQWHDEADRNQGTLLPEPVEEYVSEQNPVRFINAFVGELDLAKLGLEGMEPRPKGRLGYHLVFRFEKHCVCASRCDASLTEGVSAGQPARATIDVAVHDERPQATYSNTERDRKRISSLRGVLVLKSAEYSRFSNLKSQPT
jgi:hypothetical protein